MPNISITADFNSVQAESNKLTAQLQAVNDRVASVTSTIGQFNSIGNQVGATVRGLTKDGKEFTATLGIIDKFEKQVAASIAGANVQLGLQKIAFKDTAAAIDTTRDKTGLFEASLNRAARAAQYFVTYRAFNAITTSIESGVKAANEFQIRLSLIRTLSQENQQTSNTFGKQVRRVSDATGFDIKDVGKSFYDAISNQVAKGPQVEAFARTVADLARVTGSELTDAGNTVTATLNAYNLSATEAEKVSAVLFRVVDEGRIVLSETANTLGRVQVIAASLGVTFQEVGAILAVTTQKGFKTADAMTLLTNLLIKLEKPTQATAGFFSSLGVDSGEAAVKLYGTYGILRKIVEEVRSGRTDVSAFFDEIRGRKQFAVFEQSIDQIERFGDSLNNTAANIAHYRQAINIRGESSADFLNNQANQLSNIFKVDIGTRILDTAAALVKYGQSVRDVIKESETLSAVVDYAGKGLAAYALYAVGARAANYALSISFVAVGNALVAVSKRLVIIAAIAAAYAFIKDVSNKIIANRGLAKEQEFDPEVFARGAARLSDLRRQEAEAATRGPGGAPADDSLEATGNRAQASYRQVLGILAQVNIANNRVLDDAKKKAAEVAEATKAAFSGFADRVKEGINAIKKAITESRNEIDKSAKSLERIRTTNDDIIFGVQQRYATADQKILLNKQRIQDLIQRAGALLTPNATGDQRDEGRRLFEAARRLTAENFEAEQDLALGKNRLQGGGGATVFLTQLRQQLADITAQEEASERSIQDIERQRIANNTTLSQQESVRLDRLQQALKNLQELTPLNAEGKVKAEYQTNGQFDRAKFEARQRELEQVVRGVAGGTADQRFQLEIEFSRFRQSNIREASAVERAEIVRTTQARITADEEALQKKINDEKKAREDAINNQTRSFSSLGDTVGQLRGLSNVVREDSFSLGPLNERVQFIPAAKNRALEDLNAKIKTYEDLLKRAETNADTVDGKKVFRIEDIEAARAAYDRVITAFQEIQRLNNRTGQSPAVNGSDLNQTSELAVRELGRLTAAANEFGASLARQSGFEDQIRQQVLGPLATLRQTFPDLAAASDAAFRTVAARANQTTTDAIQPLIRKVRELREELQKLGQPAAEPRAAIDGPIDDAVGYAAFGGVAGQFPGKPRGMDRYPIWAAKDEFIVNAQSSRMFRPMLEAINNRRAPRYMAQGGVVGGDTNIGDINVTVNGGATNADTGRTISAKLAREFRRGNITRRK